jgi:hypothetical protein
VTETLRLTSWTPARPTPKSARVEAWRAQPDVSRLEAVLAGADREEAAAILALAEPNHHTEVASRVLLAANAADRPALARVAVGLEPGDRLRLLARLSPLPPMSEAQLQALVNHIAAEDRPAAQRVVRGDWPVYREVLLASDDAARAAACAGETLETEELGAIIRRFSTPGSAVERLAVGVPEERRAALVVAAIEALTFDSERLELLSGRFAWFSGASDDTLLALWKSFGFDAERAEAVGQTVRALPPARRADALVLGVESMAFDDGRTALLDALPEVVATLTAAQKQRVVAAYRFRPEEARARLGLRP